MQNHTILKTSAALLLCVATVFCTACSQNSAPPAGTGIVTGFESRPKPTSSVSIEATTSTDVSTPATSALTTSKSIPNTSTTIPDNTAELKALCNEYAKHNLIYTVAQWSFYAEISYDFLSAEPAISTYFAIDTSKKELHCITESNGQLTEVYYSRSKRLLYTRTNNQLTQATPEQADQFDFEAQAAQLAPDTNDKLTPEDILSYRKDGEKHILQIKYSEKFASLYESLGADTSCAMTLAFGGKDVTELYETITVKGNFTLPDGSKKTGTATIKQESFRLWNVPKPSWLQ